MDNIREYIFLNTNIRISKKKSKINTKTTAGVLKFIMF